MTDNYKKVEEIINKEQEKERIRILEAHVKELRKKQIEVDRKRKKNKIIKI